MVDSNGQNSIVLSAGANGKVSSADVEHASFLDFKLLLLQLEITPTVFSKTPKRMVHRNLNPAPAKKSQIIFHVDLSFPTKQN
jgi:hypothetical protein